MEKIRENRRLALLVLVVAVMLCLLVVLAINLFFRGGDDVAEQPTPTPTVEATDDGPDVIVTLENTPTPTLVIIEEPTEEPVPEETDEAPPEETDGVEPEPTEAPTPEPADDFASPPSGVVIYDTDNLLKNGDFEEGFDEATGAGLHWASVRSGQAVISFSPESAEPFVQSGESAQRISVQEAHQTNQYAVLYQTLDVVPGQSYTLTIHGQIRTFYGDVNGSGYGYRVQYAIDPKGGQNWQAITETAWIELPWGEEKLDTGQVQFSEFSEQITMDEASDQITLFIRTWNKWADPKLVEYTLDNLSFTGAVPNSATPIMAEADAPAGDGTAAEPGNDEEMIDRPLPVTGTGDGASFLADARFWGGVIILLVLTLGAVYQARWRW